MLATLIEIDYPEVDTFRDAADDNAEGEQSDGNDSDSGTTTGEDEEADDEQARCMYISDSSMVSKYE